MGFAHGDIETRQADLLTACDAVQRQVALDHGELKREGRDCAGETIQHIALGALDIYFDKVRHTEALDQMIERDGKHRDAAIPDAL